MDCISEEKLNFQQRSVFGGGLGQPYEALEPLAREAFYFSAGAG
jgi:hypothetical protein